MAQVRELYLMDLHQFSTKPAPSRKQITDALQIAGKLDALRVKLKGREDVLLGERKSNQELKRSISRIQDEARIAQRRAALTQARY
jgi:low affinity Fe/Cu permease